MKRNKKEERRRIKIIMITRIKKNKKKLYKSANTKTFGIAGNTCFLLVLVGGIQVPLNQEVLLLLLLLSSLLSSPVNITSLISRVTFYKYYYH
jgi:hypothetical protein